MPNWTKLKKMAEAFGRASYGKNDAEKPVAKWARTRFDKDVDRYDDPEASARAEAFARGRDEAWMDDWDTKHKMGMDKYRANPDEVERHMDELGEAHTDERLGEELDAAIKKAEGQADYAGRMKGMREGELADDAIDEAVSEDYGQQYLDEFKRRLTEGNVADALRWAAEEYEKYSK